jgi:phosphoribosylamine---glycine ligase
MNILLLGSGGREHALAKKISQSAHCTQLFIAPGNGGTHQFGENINLKINDFQAIKSFCINNNINMVVVGPEEPLVLGIYDYFKREALLSHINVIGPSQEAAKLEGSKDYAKAFMKRHSIPTADYATFTKETLNDGVSYLTTQKMPIVLKADGLAAGKGVIICQTLEEAQAELTAMLAAAKFGEASSQVVIESFLDGIEMSVFALTDGINYVLLPNAKDYKRIGVGDQGLNTGGMGAISPVPFATPEFMEKVINKVIAPTINGLAKDNLEYIGFVFIGLIKVGDEPFVIEYNCRMGDPETEVVMPRLASDLVELFNHAAHQTLNETTIEHHPMHAATIMCVSGGYPQKYTNGYPINIPLSIPPQTTIYHAGTTLDKENNLITNGGRVLAITTLADDLATALNQSKALANDINFQDKYFRQDIGYEFV